jgi:hypothetical protein
MRAKREKNLFLQDYNECHEFRLGGGVGRTVGGFRQGGTSLDGGISLFSSHDCINLYPRRLPCNCVTMTKLRLLNSILCERSEQKKFVFARLQMSVVKSDWGIQTRGEKF